MIRHYFEWRKADDGETLSVSILTHDKGDEDTLLEFSDRPEGVTAQELKEDFLKEISGNINWESTS